MKISFATCFNRDFEEGGMALVRSIRRYFSEEEAPIHAMIEEREFRSPAVKELMRLGVHVLQANVPSDRPTFLKAKAWVTKYALDARDSDAVLHVDADAVLLSRLEGIDSLLGDGDMLAFRDGPSPGMRHYRILHGKPARVSDDAVRFNCGVVLWRSTDRNRSGAAEFCRWCDTGYVWSIERNDQFLLHDLVAAWIADGGFKLKVVDDPHWNPVGPVANELRRGGREWTNQRTGKRQMLWHAVGSGLPWQTKVSDSVQEMFRWAKEGP